MQWEQRVNASKLGLKSPTSFHSSERQLLSRMAIWAVLLISTDEHWNLRECHKFQEHTKVSRIHYHGYNVDHWYTFCIIQLIESYCKISTVIVNDDQQRLQYVFTLL